MLLSNICTSLLREAIDRRQACDIGLAAHYHPASQISMELIWYTRQGFLTVIMAFVDKSGFSGHHTVPHSGHGVRIQTQSGTVRVLI